MKRISILLLIGLAFSCSQPVRYDMVIENIHFFDGHKDHGVVNIAINGDTIAAISSTKLESDSLVNGNGKFLIPGLVNAHVHASKLEDLKAGFPLGVMYLLNMHTGLEDRESKWKHMSSDSIGYSILYGSGHAATVPGGHPTQFSPDMETINDSLSIQEWVDHRIVNGVDYIKIIHVNHGFMGDPAPPSLSYGQIKDIIAYAHDNGFKVVVHATTAKEMIEIAKFKPDGFVHMIDFKDELPLDDHYYKIIKESGVFIVPTGGISLKSLDGLPPFMVEWVQDNLLNAEERAAIIKMYHENNILLVAGTDAQEGQMDFAEDYFLELELYQMAGLSNLEILKAATGNAAKAFELPIGELRTGSKATFLVLNKNPLENIMNITTINQIWKNGKTK
ncbi:amidohydrolase family protein [Mangrovimonas futianensis]|uniref:amidohydrolase family protein n=1 Tax=Mangrovimonas futianensis TaxID=2895523 RepID=UPI001E57827F|nr:amidohydrolase family protein [Mangrovimonas futianensis]MCF1422252.1 amidohydrolase family protein [Mangrovimonas futianensis]